MIFINEQTAYASSEEEAKNLQAQMEPATIRVNVDFSVGELKENYWFPQDWPESEEDCIWIVDRCEAGDRGAAS